MPSVHGPVAGGGPSPTRAEVEVHCPSGPAHALPGPVAARDPGWAFCHKSLGWLRVWALGWPLSSWHSLPHRPEGPHEGPVAPHAAGPVTKPERWACGQPHPCSPAWSPPQGGDLIPYLTPAPTGVPQEGKTEAAQLPPAAWEAAGHWGETHPQPRARSWGRRSGQGTATSSLPPVPTTCLWGLGSRGARSPGAPQPPHLHPPDFGSPQPLPLLPTLWLIEMSCLKLSPD